MANQRSTLSTFSSGGTILIPSGSSQQVSGGYYAPTNGNYTISGIGPYSTIYLTNVFVTEDGTQLTDIEEIYKHVSKLYFDKQMKDVINEDSASK